MVLKRKLVFKLSALMEFHAFSCKTCDDSFEKRESLPWHEEVFHAFTCKTCGEKFAINILKEATQIKPFHVTHVVTNS